MFFSSETAAEKTEIDEKTMKDTDETVTKNEKAATKSDMKTKERNKQTVIAAVIEAVTTTAAAAETNTEIKKITDSKFKKNIRLLVTIQMMLKVLFIFQMSLLCFHVNQSSVR